MSIKYICKPDFKLAIVVWDGMITLDNWREHLPRMLTDPDYVPMKLQISDLRFSSIDPSISNDQIQAMIDSVAVLVQKVSLVKLAIVAGNDWSKPKIAELGFQSLSIHSIVFNDLVTACSWLGVNEVEVGRDIQKMRLEL